MIETTRYLHDYAKMQQMLLQHYSSLKRTLPGMEEEISGEGESTEMFNFLDLLTLSLG